MITDKQFEVLKEFNQTLVRIKPSNQVVNDAKLIMTKGVEIQNGSERARRQKAKSMVASLEGRQEVLEAWVNSSWTEQIELYNKDKERLPQDAVFNAVKEMRNGKTTYAAAKSNGVNDMTVTALDRRIGHYDKHAQAFKEASL